MSMLRVYLSKLTVEALERAFGGRVVAFPTQQQGKLWDELVAGVGEDHAEQCRKWLPGEKIHISAKATKRSRDESIRDLSLQGWTPKQISEVVFTHRYSERHIQRILKGQNHEL